VFPWIPCILGHLALHHKQQTKMWNIFWQGEHETQPRTHCLTRWSQQKMKWRETGTIGTNVVRTCLTLTTTLDKSTPKYLPQLPSSLFILNHFTIRPLQFNGFLAFLHSLPLPQTLPPLPSVGQVQLLQRFCDLFPKGSEEPQNGNFTRLQN